MFTKVAKRVARRSMPVQAEEVPPSIELPSQRQIVDCAPDLFCWCDLQTPFPAVSYGGYIKYYKTRSTNNHADPPSYTPRLANLSPASGYTPPVSTPLFQKLKPTLPKILRIETVEPVVTPRKARGFSLPLPGENSRRSSSPFVLWKEAVHVLTPDTDSSVGSHSSEQIVSELPLATTGLRLPSLGIPRSPSKGSSDSSSSDFESTPSYQHSRRDSYSTYPDTPATSYSECGVDHFSAIVVKAG